MREPACTYALLLGTAVWPDVTFYVGHRVFLAFSCEFRRLLFYFFEPLLSLPLLRKQRQRRNALYSTRCTLGTKCSCSAFHSDVEVSGIKHEVSAGLRLTIIRTRYIRVYHTRNRHQTKPMGMLLAPYLVVNPEWTIDRLSVSSSLYLHWRYITDFPETTKIIQACPLDLLTYPTRPFLQQLQPLMPGTW